MSYLSNSNKKECYGCRACQEVCSKTAIIMKEDTEGFYYPEINTEKCSNCGLCQKICPKNQNSTYLKNEGFLSKAFVLIHNSEDTVFESTSGGAFTAIIEAFCDENYVVFGVEYSRNFAVRHNYSESIEDCVKFKKSKYVQSNTNESFQKVKDFLELGKKVIFTGTPCQIASLKSYLTKEYENLLCVDLVCNGVPSQKLFNKYISELEQKSNEKITEFTFRYKNYHNDINKFTRAIQFKTESGKESIIDNKNCSYLKGYHASLFNRPCCEFCEFSTSTRISDITIADYWGINKLYPDLDPFKGVSLILTNSRKGEELINKIKTAKIIQTKVDFAIENNGRLRQPMKFNKNRTRFFDLLEDNSFDYAINRCVRKKNMIKRLISKIIRKIF